MVDGVPESIKRRGLTDSILRFAINLYGAPPLKGKEFADYRAGAEVETIVGTALALSAGYSFTRQLGVKIAYMSVRAQESVGQDSDSIAVGFSVFW